MANNEIVTYRAVALERIDAGMLVDVVVNTKTGETHARRATISGHDPIEIRPEDRVTNRA